MNADKPTILVPEQHGTPFGGGFYGGKIQTGPKIFGIAWSPKALGERTAIWLPSYKDVPNASSCFHSMDNTIAMAEAGSELAQWALEQEINGEKGWCIPARDVLELGYRNLKPGTRANYASFRDGDNPSSIPPGYPYTKQAPIQTVAEAFRKGGAEAFEEDLYWSSTQCSENNAWYQNFNNGNQNNNNKEAELRARLVRLIHLNP